MKKKKYIDKLENDRVVLALKLLAANKKIEELKEISQKQTEHSLEKDSMIEGLEFRYKTLHEEHQKLKDQYWCVQNETLHLRDTVEKADNTIKELKENYTKVVNICGEHDTERLKAIQELHSLNDKFAKVVQDNTEKQKVYEELDAKYKELEEKHNNAMDIVGKQIIERIKENAFDAIMRGEGLEFIEKIKNYKNNFLEG